MQTCTTCLFIYNRFKELFFMRFRLKSGCKGKRFIFNHQMFSKVFLNFFFQAVGYMLQKVLSLLAPLARLR